MKTTKLAPLIHTILEESNFRKNPYFIALREGSFSKSDFIETQIQFFFAVVFFNRPMMALAAKIPTAQHRLEIIRNVWEEHGEGTTQHMHSETFLIFLKRLGNIEPDDIKHQTPWPEIRAFNTALMGSCALDEYLIGLSVMGIIERMFAEISAWIGKEIVNHNWIEPSNLIHYTLHEALDMKHSEDFFDVLQYSWEKSADDQDTIEQGLRLGAYIFNRLYEDLYHSRTRRIQKNYPRITER